MISWLSGKVKLISEDFLILDCGGIGFKIFLPQNLLQKIRPNKNLQLFTYLYRGQDEEELYGFSTFKELEFFELLLKVSGIGPRLAQGIISLGSLEEIKAAIKKGDKSFLTQVAGLGPKSAARIIVELKDKIELKEESLKSFPKLKMDKEIQEALVKLGYTRREIQKVLKELPSSSSSSERLKAALKILSQR